MVIYKITNLINNKIYIGLTTKTIEQRFDIHKYSSKIEKYSNIKLYRAFNKYGIENFKIEQIDFAISKEELEQKEIFWIDKLNSMDDKIGYNMCLGGKSTIGYKHTNKTKIKLSKKRKEAIKKGVKAGKKSKKVALYNYKNELVAEFETFSNCAKALGIDSTSISRAIKTNGLVLGYKPILVNKIEKEFIGNLKKDTVIKYLKINPKTLIVEEKLKTISNKAQKIVDKEDSISDGFRYIKNDGKIKSFSFEKFVVITKETNSKKEFLFLKKESKKKLYNFMGRTRSFFNEMKKNKNGNLENKKYILIKEKIIIKKKFEVL